MLCAQPFFLQTVTKLGMQQHNRVVWVRDRNNYTGVPEVATLGVFLYWKMNWSTAVLSTLPHAPRLFILQLLLEISLNSLHKSGCAVGCWLMD